jgi:hypothetical protein
MNYNIIQGGIYTCAYEWGKKQSVLNGKRSSPRVPHCALLLAIETVKVLYYIILYSIYGIEWLCY